MRLRMDICRTQDLRGMEEADWNQKQKGELNTRHLVENTEISQLGGRDDDCLVKVNDMRWHEVLGGGGKVSKQIECR